MGPLSPTDWLDQSRQSHYSAQLMSIIDSFRNKKMVSRVSRDGAVAKQTQQPACRPSIKTRPRNYRSAPVPSSRDRRLASLVPRVEGEFMWLFSLLIFTRPPRQRTAQEKKSSGSNPRRQPAAATSNQPGHAIANRPSRRAPRNPALPSHRALLLPRLPLRAL